MIAASVALLFFWLAIIFAVFGFLAWLGDKVDKRSAHRDPNKITFNQSINPAWVSWYLIKRKRGRR